MTDDEVTKAARDPIPDGGDVRELAEFWETHDVTDYEDELEEVTEPLFERDEKRAGELE